MVSIQEKALRESAYHTLETLAFTAMQDSGSDEIPLKKDSVGARVSLGDDGLLDIFLNRPFLNEITAVLFCQYSDPLDDGIMNDTLLEIANVIAGCYMDKIHEGKSDFTMGLPVLLESASQWQAHPVRLTLESGPDRQISVGLIPTVVAILPS